MPHQDKTQNKTRLHFDDGITKNKLKTTYWNKKWRKMGD